jgi:hypothetical protein
MFVARRWGQEHEDKNIFLPPFSCQQYAFTERDEHPTLAAYLIA